MTVGFCQGSVEVLSQLGRGPMMRKLSMQSLEDPCLVLAVVEAFFAPSSEVGDGR